MTCRLLVGDVFDRMAELDDGSFDLIVTSPPFLALRSYLPDDHPDKAKEIGSEATPAEYLDVLLALTAEWRRLLAPHGSIAVELGDTYAGSGGAGGDYGPDGLRDGQPKFRQAANWADGKRGAVEQAGRSYGSGRGRGWPLDKSLVGIPTLYAWSLAYGRNLLTAPMSARELLAVARASVDLWNTDGRVTSDMSVNGLLDYLDDYLTAHEERRPTIEIEPWRVRNVKPWIRSNPPVGALGDKERPATSYITVACNSAGRWFDLDAVRTPTVTNLPPARGNNTKGSDDLSFRFAERVNDSGGAPPLDWIHHVDLIIDNVIDQRARDVGGRVSGNRSTKRLDQTDGNWGSIGPYEGTNGGVKGVHIRRALETAGILQTLDAIDCSPRGYAGAHYAVWPPELVRLLVDEMCPRRVCVECGEPSRRIVDIKRRTEADDRQRVKNANGQRPGPGCQDRAPEVGWEMDRRTLGWSDCGCPGNHWRPGRVLDPFSGSGTTLAVASGMGRDSVGIDLDPRNADLTAERVGMFLEVDYGTKEVSA